MNDTAQPVNDLPEDADVYVWRVPEPAFLEKFQADAAAKREQYEQGRKEYRLIHPHRKVGTGDGIRAPKPQK